MPPLVVTLTGTDEMAQAIDGYLNTLLPGDVDVCYMTYEASQLSDQLIRQADLFLLELLRPDALGFRAEGLYVAKGFAARHKRILLFSGDHRARDIRSDCYWDFASPDSLCSRVERLLAAPQPVSAGLENIPKVFQESCRPAPDSHHR